MENFAFGEIRYERPEGQLIWSATFGPDVVVYAPPGPIQGPYKMIKTFYFNWPTRPITLKDCG